MVEIGIYLVISTMMQLAKVESSDTALIRGARVAEIVVPKKGHTRALKHTGDVGPPQGHAGEFVPTTAVLSGVLLLSALSVL